jgi:hypothetical protein
MTYRAEPITQRDGSEWANSNCLMAAGAVGLDYHTLGRKLSDGADMRRYSGDDGGGTSTDDLAQAWRVGYDETARQRDGHTWEDAVGELREGRAVMIQVWHATMGGPCLSGSGAYGHGITIAPEQHSDGRWLVADPWCKPPTWVWWEAWRIRDGAEEWAGRCAREVEGRGDGPLPDMRGYPLALIHAAARRLRDRWHPGDPGPAEEPLEAGGGGILYASSAAHGGTDMAVNTTANEPVTSSRRVALAEGTDIYADAELTQKLTDLSNDRVVPLLGTAVGADGRAVLVNVAGALYDDGESRPTIVYVKESALGAITPEPGPEPPPEPEPPAPSEDVAAAVAERDRLWREWMADDPEAPDRA